MGDEGLGSEILVPKFSMADHPQDQSSDNPQENAYCKRPWAKEQSKLNTVSFNSKSFFPNTHTHPNGCAIYNSSNILSLITS